MSNKIIAKFYGITHLPMSDRQLAKWKTKNCSRNIHLFDEVLSPKERGKFDHYLVCDACELMVHIDRVDTTYCEKE